MKIWYQSASSYRYGPVYEEYGKTVEEHCKEIVRPDTEVYVTGTPVFMREVVRFKYVMYYHKSQLLNNMLKAEREGYDAIVIGCTLDAGLEEGREMLSIPVVGISQTSYYLAAMLGQLFAIVTTSAYLCEQYRQLVIHYGLSSRHLQGNYYFPITEEEGALAIKKPETVIDKFRAEAEKAVADGASVIIPAPGTLPTLIHKAGLSNVGEALVLDSVSVAVKFAEMLVDLKKVGVEASRKLGVYGSPGKQLLRESLEAYSKVFKIEY